MHSYTREATIRFCDRYIDRCSRTHDQMVQAARSGVQNIAEGSQAQAFETDGGFTERLYRVRARKRSTASTKSTPSTDD